MEVEQSLTRGTESLNPGQDVRRKYIWKGDQELEAHSFCQPDLPGVAWSQVPTRFRGLNATPR